MNYDGAKAARQKYLDAVLNSQSRKKIVIAGPGTGKTYLFKKLLEGKKNSLTLTFVNSLVEDLSLDLCGMSEVRTLHSFARARIKNAAVSPKLSRVISEDAKLLNGGEVNFDKIFYERDDQNPQVAFYSSRRRYYEHYGYTDIIFGAKNCSKRMEPNSNLRTGSGGRIPRFQPARSVSDRLACKKRRNPILIVGDDDQALYDFRASPALHIRARCGEGFPDYATFTLPYCSRCTRVIVGACNDVLNEAVKRGSLKGRVTKNTCTSMTKPKTWNAKKFPNLTYTQQYAAATGEFLAAFGSAATWPLAGSDCKRRRPFSSKLKTPCVGPPAS